MSDDDMKYLDEPLDASSSRKDQSAPKELLEKSKDIKLLSKVERRLMKSTVDLQQLKPPEDIAFHHTVFCQTSLPYRNPGKDVRRIERKNGNVFLEVDAGRALDPAKGEFVDLPLPSGPKARLILCYLNAEAMKQQSPVIDVQRSLTAFVKRLNLDPKGRNINAIKRELSALAASTMRLGFIREGHAVTMKQDIVQGFDLWFLKEEDQRVLWPSVVWFSEAYYESLMSHAVPLDDRAVAALSHSAMALDIYAWLAQRLHRIPENKPQFIPWLAVKDQFGQGFDRMDNFKRKFRIALKQVMAQYLAAQLAEDERGLTLFHSLPSVPPRGIMVVKKPGEK